MHYGKAMDRALSLVHTLSMVFVCESQIFANLPKDSHSSWAGALGILWARFTHHTCAIYGLCVMASL